MSKIKYRFNPETLSYHKIEIGIKKRLIRLLPSIIFATVTGTLKRLTFSAISWFVIMAV